MLSAVLAVFKNTSGNIFSALVYSFVWRGQKYIVQKQNLYHKYKMGNKTFHVFNVSTQTLHFKLCLDGTDLIWRVEEVFDPAVGT